MSNNTSDKKIKWTILFIVHAVVEETRVYSEKLFAELLQANIDPDKVQVFVLHDTYDYDNSSEVHAILYEIKRNKPTEVTKVNIKEQHALESKSITHATYSNIKELTAPISITNVTYNNTRLSYDLEKISISDEKGLDQVFDKVEDLIKAAEKDSPDSDKNINRKRILVTWDHSNGFGFFNTAQTDVPIEIIKSSRRPDMLMVRELQKALKNYLDNRVKIPGKKIEILIMMHCWMQNIEAGYQLKDVVEILIGAETVFDFQGYDFANLITTISKPDFDDNSEELAKQILTDIPKKLDKIKHKPSEETEIFVSATRPNKSGLIKEQIDQLANELRKELIGSDKNLKEILSARAGCFELTKVADGYTPWYFVDIFEAIKKLESKHWTPQIEQIAIEINKAFGQYIIKALQVPSGKELPDDFKGVSICFPYQNDTFTIGAIYKIYYAVKAPGDEGPDKRIDFAKGNPPWPSFLNALLTEVGNAVRKKAEELREANKKKIIRRKRESPTADEITQIVDKILSPVVNWQNFTLELTINFDMIEAQFLVNSMIANCTAVDETGEVTLFKTNPGDPKRGVPGDPKRGVPGDPKRGVPGDPKRGVPGDPKRGVPGELLSPTVDGYGQAFSENKKELFESRGYFWETEDGAEEKKQ